LQMNEAPFETSQADETHANVQLVT
jgi:hypothetical protein